MKAKIYWCDNVQLISVLTLFVATINKKGVNFLQKSCEKICRIKKM